MQSNQPNIDPNTGIPHSSAYDPVVLPPVTLAAPASTDSAESVTNKSAEIPAPARDCVEIWNMPFDIVTLTESIDHIGNLIDRGQPSYVITANLNYVMLHNRNDDMKAVTADADLIVADGQPIVLRSKLSNKKLPERVAGSEMIYRLAEKAAEKGWKIYFLGGELGVADLCATRLQEQYPGLQIAGVESPPFRALTADEQLSQDQRIKDSGADILLVAFGQPKGEQWIHQNHKRLGVPVSIQLGASFDFVAGTAKRAPAIWQKTGLEWFYRMVNDPGRLVKRYSANAWFLLIALIQDWRKTVNSWGMGLDSHPERRG